VSSHVGTGKEVMVEIKCKPIKHAVQGHIRATVGLGDLGGHVDTEEVMVEIIYAGTEKVMVEIIYIRATVDLGDVGSQLSRWSG